jgi:hypothetical protein
MTVSHGRQYDSDQPSARQHAVADADADTDADADDTTGRLYYK